GCRGLSGIKRASCGAATPDGAAARTQGDAGNPACESSRRGDLQIAQRRTRDRRSLRHTQTGLSAARRFIKIVARISGNRRTDLRTPAMDREFGTIDFLTLPDLRALPAIIRAHFLR